MKNGEVVELLIAIKDSYPLTRQERDAINEACNHLERENA